MANEIHIKYVLNSEEFAKESEKVEKAITGVQHSSQKAEMAVADWSEEISLQKKILKEMERSYKELAKSVDKMGPGLAQQKASRELASAKREIDLEKEALFDLERAHQKWKNSNVTLRTQIRHLREEMSTMTEGTAEYAAKMQELGVLQDRYNDISKQGQIFADDEKNIRAATEVLQGLAGAMSVVTGMAGLLGASQERLEKIQVRLQSVMAISIGMNQVAQVLNKDSYVSHLLLTRAKNGLASATNRLSVALNISNASAKALMGTLTLGLSVAVTAAIAGLDRLARKQRERREALADLKRAEEAFASSVATSAAKQVVVFKELQVAWKGLTTELQKKQFIEDNKSAFEGLGVAVSSASDAENLFVRGADAMVSSLKARAYALAQVEMATEHYKRAIAKELEAQTRDSTLTTEDFNKARMAGKGLDPIARGQHFKEDNFNRLAAQFAKGAGDAIRKDAEKDVEIAEKIMQVAFDLNRQADESLSDAGIKKLQATSDSVVKIQSSALADYQKLSEALSLALLKLDLETEQKRIDQMKEGADKSLKQLELNLARELRSIKEYKEKQVELYQEAEKAKHLSQGGSEATFKPSVMSFGELPQELQDYASEWLSAALLAYEDGRGKLYQEVLSDYEAYANAYLSKVKQFESERENLESGGASEEVISRVSNLHQQLLLGLEEEMGVREASFVSFIEGVVSMGLEELLDALEEAQELLQQEASMGNEQSVAALKAQITALKAQISALSQESKSKKEAPANKWKGILSVMHDVKAVTSDVVKGFDGMSDSTKDILEAAVNVSTGVISMLMGITTLSQSSSAAITSTSQAASASIKALEKASVILAVVSAAMQVISAVANTVTRLFSRDRKREREIKRLQDRVDALTDSYESLSKAIDKAYSSDASKLIRQQESNLKAQRVILQEQLQLEKRKKKKDKAGIKELEETIKKIDEQLSTVKDRTIDAIIGTDVKNAIGEFADAWVDAWAAGEDKALAMKDVVRRMIKSAVSELVKSRLSPEVEAFMSYLATAMEDGILSQTEERFLDTLEAKIYEKANAIDKGFDKYIKDPLGAESSLAGQIRGSVATEQSVSELGGIFRGQWDSLKRVEDFSDKGVRVLTDMLMLSHKLVTNTGDTAVNTREISSKLSKLQGAIEVVAKNTEVDHGSY